MTETLADLSGLVDEAFEERSLLAAAEYQTAVLQTIAMLDQGTLRLAEKADGQWRVNAWVQRAILLYFQVTRMEAMQAGPFEYFDRIPLKRDYEDRGVRVVAGAIARYGSHIEPGAVLMPSFVNIGAYVGSGSLVDTWATVGSGAQIGRRVHLAGGVGIGGVLEPAGSRPVIVEDDAFIGSRCSIVEGVVVEERAVLGSQVALTSSTQIIDVSQASPVVYRGRVPAASIVIPGTRARDFPAGRYQVACALIIGRRTEATEEKLQMMQEAREFGVPPLGAAVRRA